LLLDNLDSILLSSTDSTYNSFIIDKFNGFDDRLLNRILLGMYNRICNTIHKSFNDR